MVEILAICVILELVPLRKVVQRVLYVQRLWGTESGQRREQSKLPKTPQHRSSVPFELVPRDALKA